MSTYKRISNWKRLSLRSSLLRVMQIVRFYAQLTLDNVKEKVNTSTEHFESHRIKMLLWGFSFPISLGHLDKRINVRRSTRKRSIPAELPDFISPHVSIIFLLSKTHLLWAAAHTCGWNMFLCLFPNCINNEQNSRCEKHKRVRLIYEAKKSLFDDTKLKNWNSRKRTENKPKHSSWIFDDKKLKLPSGLGETMIFLENVNVCRAQASIYEPQPGYRFGSFLTRQNIPEQNEH